MCDRILSPKIPRFLKAYGHAFCFSILDIPGKHLSATEAGLLCIIKQLFIVAACNLSISDFPGQCTTSLSIIFFYLFGLQTN